MMLAKEYILGYQVVSDGIDPCVASIMSVLHIPDAFSWLACLNPHSYALAIHDDQFQNALKNADWLIPDGVGIVYASRFCGGRIQRRMTGSDIFFAIQSELNRAGRHSVFFLGSTERTLKSICQRLQRDFPNVRIAGTYSPPFRDSYSDDENSAMVAAVNAASPDVLWVGMSAPKQEKWIYEHKDRLNVRFAAAVGAVFDFYTGRISRSSPAFQALGLEWLPRLLQEPRRLWRRMLISAPLFLWHVLRQRISGR